MSCIVVNLKNDNIKVFIKKREAQLAVDLVKSIVDYIEDVEK